MDKGKLIIIAGPSKSGKTTLLNSLLNEDNIDTVNKYSSRENRVSDDTIFMDKNTIKKECDLHYSLNGNVYGYKTQEIYEKINNSMNVCIILSDLKSIRYLKEKDDLSVEAYYVQSNMSNKEYLEIEVERFINFLISQYFPNYYDLNMEQQIQCMAYLQPAINYFYNGCQQSFEGDDYNLKEITEQKYGEMLKRADEEAKIRKLVNENSDLFNGVIENNGTEDEFINKAKEIIGLDKKRNTFS